MLREMANNVYHFETNSSKAVWSRSALFAYAILLEALGYEILGHLPHPIFFEQTV